MAEFPWKSFGASITIRGRDGEVNPAFRREMIDRMKREQKIVTADLHWTIGGIPPADPEIRTIIEHRREVQEKMEREEAAMYWWWCQRTDAERDEIVAQWEARDGLEPRTNST